MSDELKESKPIPVQLNLLRNAYLLHIGNAEQTKTAIVGGSKEWEWSQPIANHAKLDKTISAMKNSLCSFGSTLMTMGMPTMKKRFGASEIEVRLYWDQRLY